MKNNIFLTKYKIHITISIIFIAWCVFVYFVVIPAIKNLEVNFDSVEMKKIENKINEEKIVNVLELKNSYDEISRESYNLEVVFSKDKIVELVKDLENIAEKTGNTINITVNESAKILEAKKIEVTAGSNENEILKNLPAKEYFELEVTLRGNYNSLMRFINKVNNIKYYNVIKSFDISSVEVKVEEGKELNDSSRVVISPMNSGNVLWENSLQDEKSKKLIVESKLAVVFYLKENKN